VNDRSVAPPKESKGRQQLLRESLVGLSDQDWMLSILRPALVAVMAVCLVVAMLAFVRRLVPDIPTAYTLLLTVIGAVASLIGSATTSWLAQPGQRASRSAGVRAAEFALVLGIIRVAIWLATDTWPGLEVFLLRPIDSLLDGYYLVAMVVVGLAWANSTAMTDDMLALALQPDDLYAARTFNDRWQDTARPVYTDRPAILRRFVGRWVVGGVILVILAAGSRYDLPESGFLGAIRQNIDPTVITAIIVYFLTGLVLISQGQLALLRARWSLQKTPSTPAILQNWPVYALGLIVGVGVLAVLLPLGGTFYLAMILTAVLRAVYEAMFAAFRFLMTLLLLLTSWMGGETPAEEAMPPAPMPTFAPEAAPPSGLEIPPWTGGVIFWGFMAALLLYAAYIYFSGKGADLGWARRLWAMLRLRWLALFGAYQSWQAERRRSEAERAAEALRRGDGKGLPGWLGLRGLDPDRQIRYYYLSLLHRAEEAGMPRQRGETPLHYAPRLAERLEADDENRHGIEELTEAFVQVRYAGQHVGPDRVGQVKQVWQRLRQLLRL
jgi:hypothetical protein